MCCWSLCSFSLSLQHTATLVRNRRTASADIRRINRTAYYSISFFNGAWSPSPGITKRQMTEAKPILKEQHWNTLAHHPFPSALKTTPEMSLHFAWPSPRNVRPRHASLFTQDCKPAAYHNISARLLVNTAAALKAHPLCMLKIKHFDSTKHNRR